MTSMPSLPPPAIAIPEEPDAPPAFPTALFGAATTAPAAATYAAAATSGRMSSPKVASIHARVASDANSAAAEAMGIDPETGAPLQVSYGGFSGIRTHYQEIYNSMSDPCNAELLAPVLAMARPDPVPNQSFVSEWGDSQRPANPAAWSAECMRTSKQVFDAPVAAHAMGRAGAKEAMEQQREKFVKNAVSTRLYYGDMLSEEKAAEADAALMAATPEEREEMLAAFRDMHAGTAHHRERAVSLSHTQYRMGFRPSAADAERRKETSENKARLQGPAVPPRVLSAQQRRRDDIKAAARVEKERLNARVEAKRAAALAAKAVDGVNCDPRRNTKPETFKSQFQIGWTSGGNAGQGAGGNTSAYHDTYAGNYNQILATLKAGVANEKFATSGNYTNINITAPFGDVNYLGQEEPDRMYPIPKYLTKRRPQSAGGLAQTTSRMSYQPRPRAAMVEQARQAREAAEASRSMRSHSTIPLGSQGLMDHPRHQRSTGYQLDYTWHEAGAGEQMAPPRRE